MNSSEKFFDEKLSYMFEFVCLCLTSFKDACISEKDYSHSINVWNIFKMNKMGDSHDLFLKTDILLSADDFEKLVQTCLE